ncbi:C4-dicarboxylate transporter DctA [Patulibacter minatonensis]|uniref:C4-dicarboxylate transporter DctA n=1 Tax=Patulibacter minatonensis TaxID=298163 RepID=UPI000A00BDC5|nr:C4-dicarboxylate transporter DctA [Patulibacter minatonensis]
MTTTPVPHTTATPTARKPWTRRLYFWVLVGILAGGILGALAPGFAASLEPVGSSFVSLIKMVIAPIIFCTVVAGIGSLDSLRKVGRIGGKSLLYFEVVTTIALVLGLVVMNVLQPGVGVHADPSKIQVSEAVSGYIGQGESQRWYEVITHMIPSSVVGAFAEGEILQVLFFAILFGVALNLMGAKGKPIAAGVDTIAQVFFKIVGLVMYAAPIGAFGAMAYTVGEYGTDALTSLLKLILIFYGTSLFFVLVVLGGIAWKNGVNIFKLLRYMKDELLIVLGTSSSESVLPNVMRKLEHLGASKQVVGLTVPTGYSFNLDGTAIYLTLAALFVAQAQDITLSLGAQLGLVGILLLTSKGAAGVTGSGFIVLAATLSSLGTVPVAGIMLIFGIDKFMSECRALTNVVGNSVASIVVARSEGLFDEERARKVLAGELPYVAPVEDAEPVAGDVPAHGTAPAGPPAPVAGDPERRPSPVGSRTPDLVGGGVA